MRTNRIIRVLTAALLLAAGPSGTHAASLLEDGDFDSLPVGTAPDYGTPAGNWAMATWGPNTENVASQISIAPAPAGGTGNALRFSLAANEAPVRSPLVINTLASPVAAASGQILNVSFDIYVEPGAAGPSLYLSDGDNRRSAQLSWDSAGTLSDWGNSYPLTVVSPYPRGVWQTVRLELDATHRRYNFYWSEKGQPISVTRSNLTFQNTDQYDIRDFHVIRFWDYTVAPPAVRASLDNIRVTTGPVITPVALDLVTAGSTTLQLLNLQAGSTMQWQFNGTDIATATNATLELSNVTTNHSGDYRAVVTSAAEVVTTDRSTVRVFDQLTITTPPQSVTVVSGSGTTGFSVAAAGPLPITYQWQRDGTNLLGKTTRFLTFGAAVTTAGQYTVVVSDANGSVVSPPATLTVLVPPTVIQAPLSQSVVAGGSVTFSAALSATSTAPFTYEWRKGTSFANSTLLTNVASAERTAFLTLNDVQSTDAGTYRLYLANAAAQTITETSLNRQWTLTVLADTDGDGLADDWESTNGLNPNDPADATTDADLDGLSNLAEFRSGTSPTNATSGLKLEVLTPTNGQAMVGFSAAALKTYTVEWSDQLSGGSWQKLSDVVARLGDRIETVTDSNAVAPSRFYRVVTPRRP